MNNIILVFIGLKLGYSNIKKYFVRPKKLKMCLQRYNDIESLKVLDLPSELCDDNDIDISENKLFKRTYDYFGKRIEAIVPKEYLDNYYRNFKTIEEKKISLKELFKTFIKTGGVVGGGYFADLNKVDLKTNLLSNLINSETHELLHVSSTYYDKANKIIYSGLSQFFFDDNNKNEVVGIAINEGYTQYFNNTFFNNGPYYVIKDLMNKKIFYEEQIIASTLEKIIGRKKLQSFYFKADLKGLIKELEKYIDIKEINKFINLTDILYFYSKDKKLKLKELDEIKRYINLFLIKAYKNSLNDYSDLKINDFMKEYIPYKNIEFNVENNMYSIK